MFALDESLRPAASGITMRLRRVVRSVELVLDAKKMKWAIKVWKGDMAVMWGAGVCGRALVDRRLKDRSQGVRVA